MGLLFCGLKTRSAQRTLVQRWGQVAQSQRKNQLLHRLVYEEGPTSHTNRAFTAASEVCAPHGLAAGEMDVA